MPAKVIVRNHVRVLGRSDGPVLMFAHGFGCDQNMWQRLVPGFVDDYRVVLFDHVGAGRSDLEAYDFAKYSSIDGYASDIVEICDELDLTAVTLVGHSISAMIAAVAAAGRPDLFAHLVLMAPSPRYVDESETGYVGGFATEDIEGLLDSLDSNYFGWASAMAPMVMGNADRPELGEELTTSFCRTRPEIAHQFARVTFLTDARAVLRRVSTPSLVLQCSDDILAPVEVGRYVHRNLSRSVFRQLHATGHCPHVSAPEETGTAMLDYLHSARLPLSIAS